METKFEVSTRPLQPRREKARLIGDILHYSTYLADKYRGAASAALLMRIGPGIPAGIFTRAGRFIAPAGPPLPFFPWRKLKYISRKPARFYCPISRRVLHSAIRSIRAADPFRDYTLRVVRDPRDHDVFASCQIVSDVGSLIFFKPRFGAGV